MNRLNIGRLSLLYATTPLWVLVINCCLYDDGALTPAGLVGVALLFASVSIPALGIRRSPTGLERSAQLAGTGAILLTALCFAGTTLLIKKLTLAVGYSSLAYWYLATLLLMGPLLLFSPGSRACLRRTGFWTIHLLMAPLFVVVMLLTVAAYALAPAAWVSSAKRSGVIFTVLGGHLFLKEKSSLRLELLAALLAVAGLACLALG